MHLMEGKEREGKNAIGVISESMSGQGRGPRNRRGYRMMSYRTDEWKYILDEETSTQELYNLYNDPQEKKNLAEKEQQKVVEFRPRIKKQLQMEKKAKEAVTVAERDRLRQKIDKLRQSRLA